MNNASINVGIVGATGAAGQELLQLLHIRNFPMASLRLFASARSVVKHAGLNPAENTSATLAGRTRISRRGRPGLRTAAWRACWAALRHNRVLAAKYAHLTGRDGSRLAGGQARAACAAALLRWLWAVITRRQPWDARIAAGIIPARAGAVTAPAAA